MRARFPPIRHRQREYGSLAEVLEAAAASRCRRRAARRGDGIPVAERARADSRRSSVSILNEIGEGQGIRSGDGVGGRGSDGGSAMRGDGGNVWCAAMRCGDGGVWCAREIRGGGACGSKVRMRGNVGWCDPLDSMIMSRWIWWMSIVGVRMRWIIGWILTLLICFLKHHSFFIPCYSVPNVLRPELQGSPVTLWMLAQHVQELQRQQQLNFEVMFRWFWINKSLRCFRMNKILRWFWMTKILIWFWKNKALRWFWVNNIGKCSVLATSLGSSRWLVERWALEIPGLTQSEEQ